MLNKILQSSKNPKEISLTIRGALMNILAFVVFAVGAAGYEMVGDMEGVIELLSSVIGTGLVLVGQLWIAWGVLRKVKINKK